MTMSSAYAVNDEQAAVLLAALIIENGKNGSGKPLRVSHESMHHARKAAGIRARDVFFAKGKNGVELKIVG